MKIQIDWCETKHIDSLNKDLKEINGKDEQGNPVKFVVWQDFPGFEGIMNGGIIDGNLWEKPGTGKFTLYPPKPAPTVKSGASGGGFKANMEKTMEKKAESIAKAQDNKELGIKTSSTIRMATDVVVATLAGEKIIDESVIKGKIKEWREWFWQSWDDPENYPPFP